MLARAMAVWSDEQEFISKISQQAYPQLVRVRHTYLLLISLVSEMQLVPRMLNVTAKTRVKFNVLDTPVFILQLEVGVDGKEEGKQEPVEH